MKRLSWENEPDLLQIVQQLQEERMVLGSSDTVLGLLAKASEKSKKRLDEIKNRAKKPYLVFVGSKEAALGAMDAEKLAQKGMLETVEQLMEKHWPGPLTLIVPASPDLPEHLVAPNGTIGLRVPDHQGLLKVLKQVPFLFSTSANKSGESVPQTIEQVASDILEQVDLIVTGKSGTDYKPSTIVDCSGDTLMVVREGAVAL